MENFLSLNLPAQLMSSLERLQFKTPTPIQACSWPPALQGQDVVGIAETGRYDYVSILTYLAGNDPSLAGKLWRLASLLSHA